MNTDNKEMTELQAKTILKRHQRKLLRNCYDNDPDICIAIYTLFPDFEYPAWDCRLVKTLLEFIERK